MPPLSDVSSLPNLELRLSTLGISLKRDWPTCEKPNLGIRPNETVKTEFLVILAAILNVNLLEGGPFGEYCDKEWDIVEGNGKMFRWYHVEFPKGNEKHSQSAHYLIVVLCPALKLQDILSLASNGPYCAYDDGALVLTLLLGFSPVGQSLLSEIPRVESPSFKFGRDEPVDKGGIVIKEHVLDFLLTRNHSKEADNHVPRYVSIL
ncbi:hypothetical protein Tco_1246971 [Tanacetum coccineum]